MDTANVKNSAASVADQLLIDSLAPELRAAIGRVYGMYGGHGGTAIYTEDDLRDAFEAGWEECAEQFETPWMSDYHFTGYLAHRKKNT